MVETATAPHVDVRLNPQQLDVVLFALYAFGTSNVKTVPQMRACVGAIDALKEAEATIPEGLRFCSKVRMMAEDKVGKSE